MRIAFWLLQDSIRHWRRWAGGFHYVRNCLAAMATLPRDEVPAAIAFVPQSLDEDLLDPELARHAPWLTTVRVPDELLELPSRQRLTELVAFHPFDVLFPAVTPPCVAIRARVVGWIADCQHRHYPQFFSPEELTYRDALFQFLIGSSDRLVCNSHSVRQDLQHFYGDLQDRERIVRFAVSPPSLTESPAPALARLGIAAPYIYLPNQFWIHKNHQTVFEAWRILRARGRHFHLVCSGAIEDPRAPGHFAELQQFIARHNLEEAVRIPGLVARRDQWELYRGAKAVLQPSLFEGWSTSIEEAKSLGKPLVVSDIPTHREQAPAGARFFSPLEAAELANVIEAVWLELPAGFSPEQEAQARAESLPRVQRFGQELMRLFSDACADPRPPQAANLLPLLLLSEATSRERLALIERISAEAEARLSVINTLHAVAEERLRVITELDQACRQRAEEIRQLNQRQAAMARCG